MISTSYNFTFNIRFVIISQWKDENALDFHLKEAHVKEFAKSFDSHTTVEQIRRYEKID